MQWLAQICVRRPVFAAVLMLVILVVGVAGYTQLGRRPVPQDRLPRRRRHHAARRRGARGGRDRDHRQDRGGGQHHQRHRRAALAPRAEGVSQVFITFILEKDVDVAAQEVRDHVNARRSPQLPRGIDPPVVSKFDPDAVAGPLHRASSREQADARDHRDRRQAACAGSSRASPASARCMLIGGRKRQINVWLDPVQLRALGLTAADVQRAIGAQNLTTPGGSVRDRPDAS